MNDDTSKQPPAMEPSALELPTLDPPGTIVVLGTTAIGIEAALYGRYLGYDVTLISAADVWQPRPFVDPDFQRIGPTFHNDWFENHWLKSDELVARWDDPLPMMPDRCLSPLAFSAIEAQQQERLRPLPSTMRQWIEDGLHEVLQTDLLRGRVFVDSFVESIDLVAVEDDQDDSADGFEDLPPDFWLTLGGTPLGEQDDHDGNHLRCECIIVADVPARGWKRSFDLPADYYFELRQDHAAESSDAADYLRSGWRQIAAVYASLAGRSDLDLYRPRRV